jgi:AcrR family transcriptional regulator
VSALGTAVAPGRWARLQTRVPAGTRARAVAATLRCFARYGVSKTTVDDVARETGCSRATLYRAFSGGKDEIVEAVVASEVARFFGTLGEAMRDSPDLEELLVRAMASAWAQISGHEALGFLVAHEPEVVWPHVAFSQLDRVLDVAGAFFEPYLRSWLGAEDARRVGEWVARLVLSHLVSPPAEGGPDEALARRLVRAFVLPGVSELRARSDRPAVAVAGTLVSAP